MTGYSRMFSILAALVVLASSPTTLGSEPERQLSSDTSMRSSPEGGPVSAFLTAETRVRVIERKGDWVRVVLEGWIRADVLEAGSVSSTSQPPSTPAAVPPPPPPTPAPAVVAPATVPAVATSSATIPAVEGLVQVKLSRRKKASASEAPVYLLPLTADLQSADASATPEARQQLAELEAQAAQLHADAVKAMQGVNFTESTKLRDRLMRQRDDVLGQRLEQLIVWHGQNEVVARSAAVAKSTTDSKGWFEIPPVPPGDYTIYTRLANDDLDVEWIETVSVGSETLRLDLDETRARGMAPKFK